MRQCFQYSGRFVLVIALLIAIVFAVPTRIEPQSRKEWEWTDKHFKKILNDLFPMTARNGLYVTYRATQDLHAPEGERPEYYFLLGFDLSAKGYGLNDYISAHVKAADGTSIYDQLLDMHRKDQGAKVNSIQSKLKIKTLDYTEAACPAVRKEFRAVQDLRFGVPNTNPDRMEIVLHPPIFEFHFESSHGQANFTLYDETHPLVIWAKKTRHELESCVPVK